MTGTDPLDAYLGLTLIVVLCLVVAVPVLWYLERRDHQRLQDQIGENGMAPQRGSMSARDAWRRSATGD